MYAVISKEGTVNYLVLFVTVLSMLYAIHTIKNVIHESYQRFHLLLNMYEKYN